MAKARILQHDVNKVLIIKADLINVEGVQGDIGGGVKITFTGAVVVSSSDSQAPLSTINYSLTLWPGDEITIY